MMKVNWYFERAKWWEVSLDRDIVFLLFMNGCVVAALLQMGAIEFKDYVRKQKDQVTHFLHVGI